MKYFQVFTRLGLSLFSLIVCADMTRATETISGTITQTVTINNDSELTGDVTCNVPITAAGANPCIAFGVDHIKLRLNGHAITGPVTPPTGCSLPSHTMYGVGILALNRTDVQIKGPGIIQHFERWGILSRRPFKRP